MKLRYNRNTFEFGGRIYRFDIDDYGSGLAVYLQPTIHTDHVHYDQLWIQIQLQVKGDYSDALRLAERFWELVQAGKTCIDLHELAREVVSQGKEELTEVSR